MNWTTFATTEALSERLSRLRAIYSEMDTEELCELLGLLTREADRVALEIPKSRVAKAQPTGLE